MPRRSRRLQGRRTHNEESVSAESLAGQMESEDQQLTDYVVHGAMAADVNGRAALVQAKPILIYFTFH